MHMNQYVIILINYTYIFYVKFTLQLIARIT